MGSQGRSSFWSPSAPGHHGCGGTHGEPPGCAGKAGPCGVMAGVAGPVCAGTRAPRHDVTGGGLASLLLPGQRARACACVCVYMRVTCRSRPRFVSCRPRNVRKSVILAKRQNSQTHIPARRALSRQEPESLVHLGSEQKARKVRCAKRCHFPLGSDISSSVFLNGSSLSSVPRPPGKTPPTKQDERKGGVSVARNKRCWV